MAAIQEDQDVSKTFLWILLDDVGVAMLRKVEADTQANRRELVRTTFAAIEGIFWSYRVSIISVAKDLDVLLADEEAAFSESVVQVSTSGSISKQDRFMPILSAFRLATRIAQRINSSIEVDFGGIGWRQMRRAIEIRNRLTHPKSQSDLSINDLDLQACSLAITWLLEVHLNVLEATKVAFTTFVDEMRATLTSLKAGDPKVLAEYEAARRSMLGED